LQTAFVCKCQFKWLLSKTYSINELKTLQYGIHTISQKNHVISNLCSCAVDPYILLVVLRFKDIYNN